MIKISLFIFCCIGFAARAQKIYPTQFQFNDHWEFVKDLDSTIPVKSLSNPQFLKIRWEKVSIPHTPQIEPLQKIKEQWQGVCYYRKYFTPSPTFRGKKLIIKFEGAMHSAQMYWNGNPAGSHQGGFLPFYIDITGQVKWGEKNCLLVRLNNRDNSQVPPGKPINHLDFNFYGGIYRNVVLIVKNKVNISEPIQGEGRPGGGILVRTENIDSNKARIRIKLDLENLENKNRIVRFNFRLLDKSGKMVLNSFSNKKVLKGLRNTPFEQLLTVNAPKLWSPFHPSLYSLSIRIMDNKHILDEEKIRIGIKKAEFIVGKLFINGKPCIVRGTNRHQEYPYIGYALSDNAQYRDAWKIKEAGFNFVRCSHYPPSPAFLDACDDLGIMVMDAIPGWQFFGDSTFQKNSVQNIRDMVRRDRNHVSILLWEASLNETEMPKPFMDSAQALVHREIPFKEVYTAGWEDYGYDVFDPARQHAKAPDYWKKLNPDKPLLMAEYGDWEYHAQNAGFNQKDFSELKPEERSSRQVRGNGEKRLSQQALNFQEAHNDNLYSQEFGDLNWVMFDYKRGYADDLESSGIMDIFRLPKFSFYFYQSQYGPISDDKGFGKPMAFIANSWNDSLETEVKVYSNCEQIELFLNGKSLGIQNPDRDQNSKNLIHPPFTFHPKNYLPGIILAKGYIGGKIRTLARIKTVGKAYKILLIPDYSGKEWVKGKNDILFFHAYIQDKEGNTIPKAQNLVQFRVPKGLTIIGSQALQAEAGIATALIKAGNRTGKIMVMAESPGLLPGKIGVIVK